MSTLLAPSAPPRLLVWARWLAFAAALAVAMLVAARNTDTVRAQALARGITEPDELELTVTFGTWFLGMANVGAVLGASAIVATLLWVGSRALTIRALPTVRQTAQLAICLLVGASFAAGLR